MSETRTAAGFVLAHIENGVAKYLLMRSSSHGNWLPPKGHADPEDTGPLQTARRELEEETGISQVTPVEGFTGTIEYDVDTERGKYHKRVDYMLAATDESNVQRSPEHSDHGWFTLNDALQKIPFEQMREVLRAADAHLRTAGLIQ
ncbi:MAG: NUDIX domain-containing protein [Planctomycetes bacterium]|nr:NUDIX domain-containing protein [Planctomycetota bacterium]